MDLQDLQDDRRSDLQYGEITEKIIGFAFELINELGTGFLESVYEKALAIPVHLVHPCSFIVFENLGIRAHVSGYDW